jgi:hypothetical protein
MSMELIERILHQSVPLALTLHYVFYGLLQVDTKRSSFYIRTFTHFQQEQREHEKNAANRQIDQVLKTYPWPAIQKLFSCILFRTPFHEVPNSRLSLSLTGPK